MQNNISYKKPALKHLRLYLDCTIGLGTYYDGARQLFSWGLIFDLVNVSVYFAALILQTVTFYPFINFVFCFYCFR